MKFEDLNLLEIGHSIHLAGSVWADADKMYLILFPDEEENVERPIAVVDMTVDQWHKLLRQSDLLETEILTRASDGTITKAIVRKSARNIDQVVSWRVFKRDEYKCRYCGNDNVPLTVDHLVLWEEGGPSTEANLLTACKKCNKLRGNTQYGAWLQSSYYQHVSKNLSRSVRDSNAALAGTLESIPRSAHVKSR